MDWLNEAPSWSEQGDTLSIRSAPGTDFWRVTYNGVVIDNGHFYYQRQTGDFQADVKIDGEYAGLYDQAGLMVRKDEMQWMKCGVEFFEEKQHASVVVTHEFSDWSFVPLPPDAASFWLRVTRKGVTIEVYYSLDGENYQMLRQAYFTSDEAIDVGVFCASPGGAGFAARFEGFRVHE